MVDFSHSSLGGRPLPGSLSGLSPKRLDPDADNFRTMSLRMGAGRTAGTGGRTALGVAAALGGIVLLGGCGLRIGPGESFSDDDTISQRVSAVLVNTGSGELRIRTGSGQETTV